MNTQEHHDPSEKTIPRQCTATSKRSGVRCRKSAMTSRTVCLAHGGKTPRGVASPHFMHGRYSTALPFRPPSTGNSRISEVPSDRRCGAQTRVGTPCKNWGRRGSGRCRMHGGTSPGSVGSLSFKHGWYSRYQPWASLRRQVEDRERRQQWVAARMRETRARREEIEAQEAASRDKDRIAWERVGPDVLRTLAECTNEIEDPKEPEGATD